VPDGVVDSLVIATRFDESGLDRSTTAALNRIQRFTAGVEQAARSLPEITLSTVPAEQSLENLGAAFDRFIGEARDLEAFPDFTTDQAQRELAELAAAFPGLQAAIQRIDASGTFGALAQQARTAVTEIQRAVAAQQRSALEAARAATIPPIPPDPNLPILARGYEHVALAVQNADQRLAGLRRTMLQQGQAASRVAGENAAAAAALGRMGASAAGIGSGFLSGAAGASRLRAGLTSVAIASSGTNAAVGQVVSGILLLGAGSTAVLGAAAGFAALGLAAEFFGRDIVEARKQAAEFLATLKAQELARLPQFEQIGLQLERIGQESEAATRRIIAMTEAARSGALGNVKLEFVTGEQVALLKEYQRQLGILTALQQQVKDEAGTDLIRTLEQQVTAFGLSGAAAQKVALLFRSDLDPATRAVANALLDELDARTRAAKVAEEHARRLKEVLRAQQALRIEAAGGGNLTQAGGIVPPAPIEIPLILRPALDREQFGTGLGDEIQAEFERAAQAARELQDLLQGVDLSLRDIGNADITGPAAAAEQLSQSIFELTRGLDAVAGASRNVGLIGDEAARAIGDVLALGDAIGQVIKSASTGNILGLVGAGINVLGGLFGGGESEHDRIVRENTEAIKRNTAARSEAFTGLGGAEDLARSIGQVVAENQAAVRLATSGSPFRPQANETLTREFAELGITLEDLQRVAEMHGLDVLDSKGRIVGEALTQLEAAIIADIQAQLKWADTLDEQTQRLDLRAQLEGVGQDAAGAFARQLEAAGALGATVIDDAFRGIDLGDPEAVRRALLGLLDAFETVGGIDARTLGKLGREDFLRLLEEGAGFLDSFNQGLTDATNELSIVPRGFRNAALAFEAQIPGLEGTRAVPLPPPITVNELLPDGLELNDVDFLDRLIPQPIQISGADLLDRLIAVGALPSSSLLPALPGDGAALPQIAASLTSSGNVLAQIAASLTTIRPAPEFEASQRETTAVLSRLAELLAKAKIGQSFSGDIILQIENDGKDAPQLALDIRRALEDLSMADFGRTDRWGQT
jgi:hypothetical protein